MLHCICYWKPKKLFFAIFSCMLQVTVWHLCCAPKSVKVTLKIIELINMYLNKIAEMLMTTRCMINEDI